MWMHLCQVKCDHEDKSGILGAPTSVMRGVQKVRTRTTHASARSVHLFAFHLSRQASVPDLHRHSKHAGEKSLSSHHPLTIPLPSQYHPSTIPSVISVPSQCHPSAISVPSHCHLTAISPIAIPLPSHYHPITISVSSHYHLITY